MVDVRKQLPPRFRALIINGSQTVTYSTSRLVRSWRSTMATIPFLLSRRPWWPLCASSRVYEKSV